MLPHLRWLGLVLTTLCLAAPAWADDAPTPPATQEAAPAVIYPAPNLTEQAAIDNELKEIDGPIPPGKLEEYPALATKLLQQGRDTGSPPAERYVLLRHAAELSAEACEPTVLLGAFQELDANFSGDRMAWKLDLVRKAVSGDRARANAAGLEDACLTIADAMAAGEDYESAIKCAGMGQSLARRVDDKQIVQAAGAKIIQYRSCQEEYGPAKVALSKLSTDPTDPESNLAVGRYECFIKNDWKNGLPMMAIGSDPTLKALAQKEVQNPTDANKQVDIANGWWAISQSKPDPIVKAALRNHAFLWYQRALPNLTGINKALASERLAEQTSAPAATPHAEGGVAEAAAAEVTAAADQLAAELNDPQFWKSATGPTGIWVRGRDGGILGTGDAHAVFARDIPADLTIGFRINVMGGAGPRVSFEGSGIVFGSDGIEPNFMIFGANGVNGAPIPYGNNEAHTVEFEFNGADFKCKVDGRLAGSGQRTGSGPMQLRLSSGDAINPGSVEYWDFRVKLNPPPAP